MEYPRFNDFARLGVWRVQSTFALDVKTQKEELLYGTLALCQNTFFVVENSPLETTQEFRQEVIKRFETSSPVIFLKDGSDPPLVVQDFCGRVQVIKN